METFLKEIKDFFDKYNLSLSKKVALSINSDGAKELMKLTAKYESFDNSKGHISLNCQNRVNDFLLLLQIFYKKNYKEIKRKIKKD